MSFKQTLILAGILILLAGYIVFHKIDKPAVKWEEPPEVWSVKEELIERIELHMPRQSKRIAFFLDKQDNKWRFHDEKKAPVDLKRWGGIVLLVSGPKSKRMIAKKVDDLSEFGLNDPQLVITLVIRDRKDPLEILLGDETPHKDQSYVKLRNSRPIYIVNHSFEEVLTRLVLEPPLPPLMKVKRKKDESYRAEVKDSSRGKTAE